MSGGTNRNDVARKPGRRVADRGVQYVVTLSERTNRDVEASAYWHACEPRDLIALAVEQYVRNRRIAGVAVGLTPVQESIVAERLAILRAWHKVRQRAATGELRTRTH